MFIDFFFFLNERYLIYFSLLLCREGAMCACSVVCYSLTLWTVAHQAVLSMGFPKQEYWNGSPYPPPGDLPDPGIEPALAGVFFTIWGTWEAQDLTTYIRYRCRRGISGVVLWSSSIGLLSQKIFELKDRLSALFHQHAMAGQAQESLSWNLHPESAEAGSTAGSPAHRSSEIPAGLGSRCLILVESSGRHDSLWPWASIWAHLPLP